MSRNTFRLIDRDQVRCQVAFLAAEGMQQKEISSVLRISQSTVSLLLQEASEPSKNQRRLLDPRPRFLGTVEEREQAQRSIYLGDLQEKLDELSKARGWKITPKIHVGFTEPSQRSWDERVRTWGRVIAPVVYELLQGCSLVSVAWGRQLRAVIDSLPRRPESPKQSRSTVIIPMWAPRLSVIPQDNETVFQDHVSLGSNSLTRDLSMALNGTQGALEASQYFLPGIDLVPFGDPPFELDPKLSPTKVARMLKAERAFIRGFKDVMARTPSYGAIFGAPAKKREGALIRRCDAMLVSSGPAGTSRAFHLGDDYGGVPRKWLEQHTAGDVAGLLLPIHPITASIDAKDYLLSPEERARVALQFERLRMHWMGPEEEDLRHAALHGKVGTVVCAVGSDRALTILTGCELQLIRHLCCDLSLANELTKVIDAILSGGKVRRAARQQQ